ncbi:hypothetical protein PASE110613_10700 [Paenibacillus sediminis]|uniref:PAS domain-containing protein n=1 Tax=Paenibacillus sediminis TaxID=664909 RepID=A0ABS4H4F7_9BACL|nr:hypothetical protein [Paenibacillus sediminis]MBP1937423.1 PAS domain-containing protein [Paenibacillus sediminis]
MPESNLFLCDEVIHSLRQGIIVIDPKGFIHSFNRAWVSLTIQWGVPSSYNWVGTNFFEYYKCSVRGNDTETIEVLNGFDAVLNKNISYFSVEISLPMGAEQTWFLIEASPLKQAENGQVKGITVSYFNITKTKLLEQELMDAASQIRTLRGLLPICAVCKRIRDEQDEWNSVESYIEKHTHVEFTHDICPDCIRRHYPKYSSALD